MKTNVVFVPLADDRVRKAVWLLCALAAVHVFVFSAAFPFFNNMDETFHFDLVVKYSHGHLPRGLEIVSPETMCYAKPYSSPEYVCSAGMFAKGEFPAPPWKTNGVDSMATSEELLKKHNFADTWWGIVKDSKKTWPNYESSQQPLFYSLEGTWWNVAPWLGQAGLERLYWLRFSNIFFIVALIWVAFACAKMIFPENIYVQIGVPAIIAVMPQQAFYSVDNDVLSPLCFGLAFLCLMQSARDDFRSVKWGAAMGLALAATFLTKLSNAPFLAVSGAFILLKMFQLLKSGKIRASVPALTTLVLCAGLPMVCWLFWTKFAFGDFSGTAAKLKAISWTPKPFAEWWHHPIFTISGFMLFLSEMLVAFWQGEFYWHANPLHAPVLDTFFVIPTLAFMGLALAGLFSRSNPLNFFQRQMLWFCLACFIGGIAFLGMISIQYDFGDCPNPSRYHPFLIAGRLILGSLIPFLLFCFSGLNFLLQEVKIKWLWPMLLTGAILFLLISEIFTDWPVFQSQYNWYHL